MPVVAHISALTLRGWITSLGVPRALVWPTLGGGVAVAVATSVLGAFWLNRSDLLAELAQPRVAVLLIVTVVWVSAFTGIFAAAAAASATGAIRFLRTLPLTDRALGAALAAPTMATAVVQAGLLSPAIGLVIARGLGQPYAAGLIYALLANIVGTLNGRMLFGLARGRARRRGRGLPPQLTAIVGLAVTIVVGELVLATQWRLAPSPAVAILAAPLGWPGIVELAAGPPVAGIVAMLAALGFAVAMEVLAWPWLTAVTDLRPRARAPLCRWRSAAPLPLLRLQLLRMTRHERVRNLLGAMLVMEALTVALVATAAPEVRVGIVDNTVLLWCLTGAGLTVIARGISARHLPFPLTLGLPARRWGGSVAGGSLVLAGLALAPPLAILAWVERSWLLLAGGFGQLLFAGAVGAILGALMTPNPGTGPLETVALGIVLAVDLTAGNLLDRATPLASEAAIGLALGAFAMPLLAVPGEVEHWRWRRDVGRCQPPQGGPR